MYLSRRPDSEISQVLGETGVRGIQRTKGQRMSACQSLQFFQSLRALGIQCLENLQVMTDSSCCGLQRLQSRISESVQVIARMTAPT